MSYAVVLTTTANKEDARQIASEVVKAKLAACVQFLSIESIYVWKDKVNNDPEILLLIKTRAEKYKEIESLIKKIHKYEVPEIVLLPIEAGSKDYLHWIDGLVR